MIEITAERLKKLCPMATLPLPELAAAMTDILPQYEINTPVRVAAFLAQIAHETDRLKTLHEYGGNAYFRKYDGRKDLGNIHPGDGARYKGRGALQITGRANYRDMGKRLGLDLENNPELAAHPVVSVRAACEFWTREGLNAIADAGDFRRVTKKINGGYNGLKDREELHKAALRIFV